LSPFWTYKKNLPSTRYGNRTFLTDGKNAKPDEFHQLVGFEENDMIAIINLGKKRTINSISAGFLQETVSWIFVDEIIVE